MFIEHETFEGYCKANDLTPQEGLHRVLQAINTMVKEAAVDEF
jgi:hypothetical protein